MVTRPSDEAHASTKPYSYGAHAIEFTEDWWPGSCEPGDGYVYTAPHTPGAASRCTTTLRSYEQEASNTPYLGCAHATCHTGPSCLERARRGGGGGGG
jgi:hypothetical protein